MKQCIFAVVLAFLMLTGCASVGMPYTSNPPDTDTQHEVTPVWIDKRFPFEQRVEIVDALLEWNYALNGYNKFEVVSDQFEMTDTKVLEQIEHTRQGLLILNRSVTDPVYDDLDPGTLAWVAPPEPIVNVLGDVIGNRNLKGIVLHEVGHYLGIYGHVQVRGSLMAPSYTYMSPCIDKLTIQTLSGYRPKYQWTKMNYCDREPTK